MVFVSLGDLTMSFVNVCLLKLTVALKCKLAPTFILYLISLFLYPVLSIFTLTLSLSVSFSCQALLVLSFHLHSTFSRVNYEHLEINRQINSTVPKVL